MSPSSSKQKRISQFFTPVVKKSKLDAVQSGLNVEDDSDEDESEIESEIDPLNAAENDQVIKEAEDLEVAQSLKGIAVATQSDSSHVSEQRARVLAGLGIDSLGKDLSNDELLLKVSTTSPEQKEALRCFRTQIVDHLKSGVLSNSVVDIDAFLWKPSTGRWDSHDAAVDELWASFVADIMVLSEDRIKPRDMVKPSGPLFAAIMFLWHYPTFRTKHPDFGHVHDRTNPSLRIHDDKFGANRVMRVQDAIPFRHSFVSHKQGGVPWMNEIPNWPQVLNRCRQFTKETIKSARIVVFVGQQNCQDWRRYMQDHIQEGDRLQQIQFSSFVDDCKVEMPLHIFNNKTAFYSITTIQGTIKQLVFLVYHSQFMLQSSDYRRGAYNDFMLNAAGRFAGLSLFRYDANVRYTGTDLTIRAPLTPGQKVVRDEKKARKEATRRRLEIIMPWDREDAPPDPVKVQEAYDALEPRLGGKPASYNVPRAVCYYVDPDSGKACDLCYSQLTWLKSHFSSMHPNATWDSQRVEWKVRTKEEIHAFKTRKSKDMLQLSPEELQKQAADLRNRERFKRSWAKTSKIKAYVCNFCGHVSRGNHSSNCKRHIERCHLRPGQDHAGETWSTSMYTQRLMADIENERNGEGEDDEI